MTRETGPQMVASQPHAPDAALRPAPQTAMTFFAFDNDLRKLSMSFEGIEYVL